MADILSSHTYSNKFLQIRIKLNVFLFSFFLDFQTTFSCRSFSICFTFNQGLYYLINILLTFSHQRLHSQSLNRIFELLLILVHNVRLWLLRCHLLLHPVGRYEHHIYSFNGDIWRWSFHVTYACFPWCENFQEILFSAMWTSGALVLSS